jgi:hypothetical protein
MTRGAEAPDSIAATLAGRALLDYLHDEVGLIEEFAWLVAQVRKIEAEAATPADSLDALRLARALDYCTAMTMDDADHWAPIIAAEYRRIADIEGLIRAASESRSESSKPPEPIPGRSSARSM